MILNQRRWEYLIEYQEVLSYLNEATLEMQRADLTISDAYGIWLLTNIKLQYAQSLAKTKLAQNLLSTLKTRRAKVLDVPHAVAATFLDPRYRNDLTPETQQTAKIFIFKILRKVTMAEKYSSERHPEVSAENFNSVSKSNLLKAYFASKTAQPTNPNINDGALGNEIESFARSANVPVDITDFNLIQFWDDRAEIYPMLYKVVQYLITIPPTQVTVERAFSTLKFICSDQRCGLSETMLETILTIKLNASRVEEIFKKELDAIE